MFNAKAVKEMQQEIDGMHLGISAAFTQVKEELSDHLDTINQNTAEFEVVSQRMDQLEGMIEKLAERLDVLSAPKVMQKEETIKLSLREQEFFLALYTSTESYSASEFARYLSLTEELVHALAHKLINKGIPVLKETDEIGRLCYHLDNDFKELQAKQNMIPVDARVLEQFSQKEDSIDY
jgi:hypothetical protein